MDISNPWIYPWISISTASLDILTEYRPIHNTRPIPDSTVFRDNEIEEVPRPFHQPSATRNRRRNQKYYIPDIAETITDKTEISAANLGFTSLQSSRKVSANDCDSDRQPEIP